MPKHPEIISNDNGCKIVSDAACLTCILVAQTASNTCCGPAGCTSSPRPRDHRCEDNKLRHMKRQATNLGRPCKAPDERHLQATSS